jgi:EmrB/QacA subfamily drug resistance transporter
VDDRVVQRWVLALTAVASVMVTLDLLVVATALSTIRVDLRASLADLEWTINAYSLSYAMLLMTSVTFGDRWGRRRVFTAGLGAFALASVGCALAQSVGALIVARAVQGASAAMIVPQALALLSAAFPAERRGQALGVFAGVTGLAILGGPVVGGAVTQGLAWQWIFWINVPVAVLLLALAPRRIPESFGPNTRLDVCGLVLQGLGALGVVWALVRGNVVGWGSAEVVATLAAGLLLLAAFVWWEARARAPMLPLGLFASRRFSAGNVTIFLLYGALLSEVFFIAQFLQVTLGFGPMLAGLALVPWTVSSAVVAPIAGRVVDRIGERALIMTGLFLQAVGMVWIALIAAPDMAYAALIVPFVLAGAGSSMAIPAAQNAVVSSVPPAAIGTASGAYNALRQFGGAFGVAVLAAVFASTGGYASAQAFSDGFGPAMATAAVLSVLGALAGAAVPVRRRAAGVSRVRGAVPGLRKATSR